MAEQSPAAPRPRDPNHSRIVMVTLLAWLGAHFVLLVAIDRANQSVPQSPFGSGIDFGIAALAIGWVQLTYGAVIALILRSRYAAVAQGIFISMGLTTLLFTALCFGGALGV